MNTLRAYKFLVMPVMQQVDEDGVVLAEVQPQQPDALFGVEALHRYADGFEEALQRHMQAINNGQGQMVPAEDGPRVT
jgi:hypothetical protein